MGGVVLTITGAEALYADMGHFGARADPPRLVPRRLPGPGHQLPRAGRDDPRRPGRVANPFFLLAPSWAHAAPGRARHRWPRSSRRRPSSPAPSRCRARPCGSGMLPRLRCGTPPARRAARSTCRSINWILFVGVLVLIAAFRSSSRLATAYGLAVTGTLLLTSALFLLLAQVRVAGPDVEARRRTSSLVVGRRADLPRRQPHEDRQRRLAAARHRRPGRRRS